MVFENVKQIIYFWSSLCSLYAIDGRFVKFQNVTGNNGVKTNLNVYDHFLKIPNFSSTQFYVKGHVNFKNVITNIK